MLLISFLAKQLVVRHQAWLYTRICSNGNRRYIPIERLFAALCEEFIASSVFMLLKLLY
jgi:hypothetical protein